MCKIFMRVLAMAGALLLSGSLASAASPTFCSAIFAATAAGKIQKVRAMGGCSQNMNDPFWSTNHSVQARWCSSVSEDTARRRLMEMENVAQKCNYCHTYADVVATAAAENIKYRCHFMYNGDDRWKPDRAFHFNGCIKFEACRPSGDLQIIDSPCGGELWIIKDGLNSILANVTSSVATCKAELGIGTSSSALSLPKTIPPLQDTIERPKHPVKPAKKCRSPTATRGCNTGLATVKPATKGGSNTSAMDRLSGDSQLPSPASNAGGKTGDGSSGRLPASRGGASAVAKPVTAPAPLPKADPTTDFGKCASCGKPPPVPPR